MGANPHYHCRIKPIWSYGIQLWGTSSNSIIEISERFQSKVLRTITNGLWFVWNAPIRRDLQMPSIKEEVTIYSQRYKDR